MTRRPPFPLSVPALALAVLAPGAAGAGAAPCFDLHEAIRAASPGQVVTVPPGTYRGPFVIDRPLILDGGGQAVLDGGGEGDVLRITAPGVTVRGFAIRRTGISLDRENAAVVVVAPRARIEDNVLEDALFGIYLKGAEDSVVRGNLVTGMDLPVQRRGDGIRVWQSHRSLIEDNVVSGSRDAVIWFSEEVRLHRNRVTNGRYGLHFMYCDRNVLEENVLEFNSVGAFLMYSKGLVLRANVLASNRGPSGYGVGLKDMDSTDARDNVFVGNRVGLHLDGSPGSTHVHDVYARNVFAFNDIGVAFMPAVKRNGFTENAFVENLEQVAVLGGGDFSGNEFAVGGRGNFWSDYRGWDGDGDGIGDLPYRAESLFESLMDREPRLRLFLFSPAQQAIEMAATAFPVVRPRPKIADERPLMRPGGLPRPGRAGRSPWPMAGLGAALLLVPALSLAAGRWRGASSSSPPPPPASVGPSRGASA